MECWSVVGVNSGALLLERRTRDRIWQIGSLKSLGLAVEEKLLYITKAGLQKLILIRRCEMFYLLLINTPFRCAISYSPMTSPSVRESYGTIHQSND
jgi:hypothetical protein